MLAVEAALLRDLEASGEAVGYVINPESLKVLLERKAIEAGFALLFEATAVDVGFATQTNGLRRA